MPASKHLTIPRPRGCDLSWLATKTKSRAVEPLMRPNAVAMRA